MKTVVAQRELRRVLRSVLPAVGGTLNVLHGVRLAATGGRLHAVCSDLALTISDQCAATGDIDCVAPAALLGKIIDKAVDGDVILEHSDEQLTITAGDTVVTLRCFNVDEWPRIHDADGDTVTLDAELLGLVGKVVHAASVDDSRPILTGVKFGDGKAVATDSYRLAAVDLGDDLVGEANVPASALKQILKTVGDQAVTVTVDERRATFRCGDTTWTTVLIEGEFPNWGPLIPTDTPHTLDVDSAALLDALDRVAPLMRTGSDIVVLHRTDRTLSVSTRAVDVGEACDLVPCDGTIDFDIGFNPVFLADMVRSAGGDTVSLRLVDQLKPVTVITGPLTVLLMPSRSAA